MRSYTFTRTRADGTQVVEQIRANNFAEAVAILNERAKVNP